MEDYLDGARDEAELEKLRFHDLSAVPGDLAAKIREMMQKAPDQEAGKLSKLLFAIGHSTCRNVMVWAYEYTKHRKESFCRSLRKRRRSMPRKSAHQNI